MVTRPPRRWLLRGLLGAVVISLLLFSGVLTVSYDEPTLEPGTIESAANGTTVIATQGWNARNISLSGRPARLTAVGPEGDVEWQHGGPESPPNWFYDVDPLENGNLLVVNPVQGTTVVYEFDPESQERVWTERFDLADIHDIDLVDGDDLVVAGINYDTGTVSNDSVFVYNRSTEEITWEWKFKNYYPDDADNGIRTQDWTHVNDVDAIRDDEFLVSPRNMDQVIAIDRATKNVTLRLGADDDHDTLNEQHNPTYFEGENGTPTILVADSENDRVVEYERTGGPPGNGSWNRTWTLSGGLNWPRDADRLPSGNTLVTDTMNHRVIEVTPEGEVVWEMYVPWATYDAERVALGDEPGGPTMRDRGVTGEQTIRGDSSTGTVSLPTVPAVATSMVSATPIPESVAETAGRLRRVAPWFKPRWLPTWGFLGVGSALAVTLTWGLGEGVYHRRRIRRALGDRIGALRARLGSN